MEHSKYTVIIQWSEEDGVYVVSLPEWGCLTHGQTYEEAAKNAGEVLEGLIESHDSMRRGPLPEPRLFEFHSPIEGLLDSKQSPAGEGSFRGGTNVFRESEST